MFFMPRIIEFIIIYVPVFRQRLGKFLGLGDFTKVLGIEVSLATTIVQKGLTVMPLEIMLDNINKLNKTSSIEHTFSTFMHVLVLTKKICIILGGCITTEKTISFNHNNLQTGYVFPSLLLFSIGQISLCPFHARLTSLPDHHLKKLSHNLEP